MNSSVTEGVQFSVFVDNRPGAMARIAALMAERGIRLLAITLAEGLDHGYLRLVADRPDAAAAAFRDAAMLFFSSPILLATIGPDPADLARLLDRWGAAGVNVEYAYTGGETDGRRFLVARVDQPLKARADME